MKEYIDKIVTGPENVVMDNLKEDLIKKQKTTLVTANSECFVHAKSNNELKALLNDSHTKIVIDGIAAFKAFKYLGSENITKIPGVDIVEELLHFCHENKLKLAVLGGSPESSDNFKAYVENEFSNINLVAIENGYVTDKDAVMDNFAKLSPDLILVGLGVPAQELLIGKNLSKFDKGLFIGCGGSLDVLGKTKKRAPKFFIVTSTEWLYRILREPNRIGRFIKSNIVFLNLTIKSRKAK